MTCSFASSRRLSFKARFSPENSVSARARKMKDFFYIDISSMIFLADIRGCVEQSGSMSGLNLWASYRRIDRLPPEFNCDLIRHD